MKQDEKNFIIILLVIAAGFLLYQYSISFSIYTDSSYTYEKQVGNYLFKSTQPFGSNTTTNLYPDSDDGSLTLSTNNDITYDGNYKIEISYSRGYNKEGFLTADLPPPSTTSFLRVPLELDKIKNVSFQAIRKTTHSCEDGTYPAGSSNIYLSSDSNDILLYSFPGIPSTTETTINFKLLNVDGIYIIKYLDMTQQLAASGNMSLIFSSSLGDICQGNKGKSAVESLQIDSLQINYLGVVTNTTNVTQNQTQNQTQNETNNSFKCCLVKITTNSSITSTYTWRSNCTTNEQIVFVSDSGNVLGNKDKCEIESKVINLNTTNNGTVCGNNICENNETSTSCSADCKQTSFNWIWIVVICFVIGGIAFVLSRK